MNKKFTLTSLLAVTTLAVVGVMAVTQAPQSAKLFANNPGGEWHHYLESDPQLDSHGKSTKRGTKEYWVECGGGYQFTEPSTGTIIEEAGAPNTKEFAANDSRWSDSDDNYCDVHGHSFDSHGVCEHCNALNGGSVIAPRAIANASASAEAAPLGFTSVSTVNGVTHNTGIGYNVDVTAYSVLYFSLYHSASYAYVFGGDGPRMWQSDWYNILLIKGQDGWEAIAKKATETAWDDTRTKVDGATDQNFSSILRMANFESELSSANIKCTEVYGILPPHSHSLDEFGICTICKEFVGATKLADSALSEKLDPENNPAAPAGFETSVRSVATHNSGDRIASIDCSNKSKLYFALYSPDFNIQICDGGGKSFEKGEWIYVFCDHTGGSGSNLWTVYGRKASESSFSLLKEFTKGGSTNLKYFFTIVNWSQSKGDFSMFSTEVYSMSF